ncbi:hypothetical protein SFC57_02615 [Niallia circulans]|uniref:hypothetical protein n=1 Tax=Niallia circulans TaxID=1397 RepID=UPI00397BEF05
MTAGVEVSNKDMEKIVQDHEKRIIILEQSYSELKSELSSFKGQLSSVELGQVRIEKTLMEEGREQRKAITEFQKEQSKTLNKFIDQTLNIKKKNNENMWKILTGIFGVGGLVYMLFDVFSK